MRLLNVSHLQLFYLQKALCKRLAQYFTCGPIEHHFLSTICYKSFENAEA